MYAILNEHKPKETIIVTKLNCTSCEAVKKMLTDYIEVPINMLMGNLEFTPKYGAIAYDIVVQLLLQNNMLPVLWMNGEFIEMDKCLDGSCKL